MSSQSLNRGQATKYFDKHFQRPAMKIQPGEFYATVEDEVIVTVLGSCISACLLDPVGLVGGMNHFMLPEDRSREAKDIFFAARYGGAAMELLINELLRLGARKDRLVAKIFGGGRVMKGMGDVGARNIEFVLRFLAQESIPIWSEDIAGDYARKIYFFPHTGQVLMRRIDQLHNDTLLDRESAFRKRISRQDEGDVELFT